jgi:hypothetical protein
MWERADHPNIWSSTTSAAVGHSKLEQLQPQLQPRRTHLTSYASLTIRTRLHSSLATCFRSRWQRHLLLAAALSWLRGDRADASVLCCTICCAIFTHFCLHPGCGGARATPWFRGFACLRRCVSTDVSEDVSVVGFSDGCDVSTPPPPLHRPSTTLISTR